MPVKICSNNNNAFSVCAYSFNSTSINYIPLTGGTTVIGSSIDDNTSMINSIGFNFHFGGLNYSQFSLSPDGWLLLGNTTAIIEPINNIISTINFPKIYPFWDDLSTGTNGNVKYLITGSAPNRILKIEWNVTIPKNINNPANSSFQLWLYEGSNTIEFHYGNMGTPTSNSISSGYTNSYSNFGSITFNTNSASSTFPNNLNATIPNPGKTYIFTPYTNFIWSPITNLYTDLAGTIPYNGDSRDIIYELNNSPSVSTYNVSVSNLNFCTLNKSVNLNNSIPFAAPAISNYNNIICPGNDDTIPIIGTPNSIVTIVNNDTPQSTYIVNIGSNGYGIFQTPPLNQTMVYSIIKVKEFYTICDQTISGAQMTVTVVPDGCAIVKIENDQNSLPLENPICNPPNETRILKANVSNVPSTTNYIVSSIPYCPQAAYSDPSYNQVNATGDDIWSSVITLPFNFCFFNQNFTTCQVGTNGILTFNPQTAPGFCNFVLGGINIPNVNFVYKNSIFGVYQDTETRTSAGQAPPEVSVNWKLIGNYPCRKLIVNFYHLGQYQCNQSVGLQTSQIVLYEISNIIEIYVQKRTRCINWQNGAGVIGILNSQTLKRVIFNFHKNKGIILGRKVEQFINPKKNLHFDLIES